MALLATFLNLTARPAQAAMVSGGFAAPPANIRADRQLHFENVVSHDLYLATVEPGGSFSTDLPPGTYNLRDEQGVVLLGGIMVGGAPLRLGPISEPGPYNLRRLFEGERLGESYTANPGPSTSNLETEDELIRSRTIPQPR